MAIVHIATKAISRKAGQSAVASAAYRAGVILKDERYDKSHDYSKKSGVMSADVILPSVLKAKGLVVSREEIWNKAEKVEGRKDSRVAREWLINLPYELDEKERKTLAHEFAQTLADKYNVIADCAIHAPSTKEIARGADPRNYHAHILVTTREAKLDADSKLFFDKQFKIPFEWSNKKREDNGLVSSVKEIKNIRQLWVDIANKALAKHDLTPLDARSFKDQGLDRLPTIKMGVDATNMERKSINTDKGNENRAVSVINKRREFTKQRKQRVADERHTIEYTEWTTDRIEWAAHRGKQVVQRLDDSQQRIDSNRRDIEWSASTNGEINRSVGSNTNNAKSNTNNVGWATKRAGQIIEITVASEQRIKRYEQQASEVNRILEKRAHRPAAPSPFDDNARRARATRLAEQQRRFDRESTEYDKGSRYQNRAVEDAYKRAELKRQQLASLFLSRNHERKRLRAGWNEDPNDYPDKFDYRQSELLDNFAQNTEIGKKEDEDIRDYHRRISQLLTVDFRTANQAMVDLLRDPKAERNAYNTVKQGFDDFLQALEAEREEHKDQIRLPIERLNATTDMVKVVATAVDYLQKLDHYIKNDTTVEMNKAFAIEQRSKTINRTVEAYKYGCQGVPNFQDADIRRTHSELLQGSLNDFTRHYGSELSKEQQQTILSVSNDNDQPSYRNTYRPGF